MKEKNLKKSGFEKSLSLGLKKISVKKVSVSVSKIFVLEKSPGIGIENIWSKKKSVSDEISGLATQCRHQTTPNYARQAQIKSVFVNKTDIKLQK